MVYLKMPFREYAVEVINCGFVLSTDLNSKIYYRGLFTPAMKLVTGSSNN